MHIFPRYLFSGDGAFSFLMTKNRVKIMNKNTIPMHTREVTATWSDPGRSSALRAEMIPVAAQRKTRLRKISFFQIRITRFTRAAMTTIDEASIAGLDPKAFHPNPLMVTAALASVATSSQPR